MNHIPSTSIAFALLLLPASAPQCAQPAPATATDQAGQDQVRIDRQRLAGRRFEFSWSSAGGSAVNGIATLRPDGTIAGIRSPNETRWSVDEQGRLLFRHADGRVSTRYEKTWLEDGLLCFEGPFLLRSGITHHLVEQDTHPDRRVHQITPARAARIPYSRQQFVYLDPGEATTFRLHDGTTRRVRVISVSEQFDSVIELARRATVRVEVEGRPLDLTCAPYVMPTEVDGIRIQADSTTAWLKMPKRVQLSIWDAGDPIVDTDRFRFPLPGYRLFSHGTQAYNEPVHLGHRDGDPVGQRFHHNYGVDFAGFEGRQKVVSCIDGKVVRVDRQHGDLSIQDEQGVIVNFGHLDSVLTAIEPGVRVRRGQWVGMLGRRGASGNFSHLHVGVFLSPAAMKGGRHNRNLNLYPWLVAAYLRDHPASLLAVARPHVTAITGAPIRFDGGQSLCPDAEIRSFQWLFHDGTMSRGVTADRVYLQPGCYMAALRVTDSAGRTDIDFCRVRVFSRDDTEDLIPTLFVTYEPTEEVRVKEPVCFRAWPQGKSLDGIRIDFGDGTTQSDYRPYTSIVHCFQQPGTHLVTFSGRTGTLPVTQQVKLVVGP